MWYYLFNQMQVGPVEEATIVTMIKENRFGRGTLVWQEGMAGWVPVEATSLSKHYATVQQVTPPVLANPQYQNYGNIQKPVNQQISELKNLFMWSWICLLGTLITFGLSAIATMVLWYIILYRCWELIQDGNPRTTPGKAVGFLFIPFYNFYWMFVAFPGWAKDVNIYNKVRGYPIANVGADLPTAMCILSLVSIIPYVGYLTAIAAFVIIIIVMNQYTQTAIRIIQYKFSN
jgi:hypothetical protein